MGPAFAPHLSRAEKAGFQFIDWKRKNGGGGGNRTRVRIASSQRVYVRSLRSISVAPVTQTGETATQLDNVLAPDAAEQRARGQPSDDARNPLEGVADGRRYASFS